MSFVDIALIVLVVLFGTVGVLRGVQKSALSFGAFLIAFIVAFFLANTVAEAFLNVEAVKSFVMGTEEGSFSLFNWLRGVIPSSAGTSDSFIDANFYRPIIQVIKDAATGMPESDALALYVSFTLFSGIIGICLFIVVRLLLSIVTMIVKSFIPKKKSALNRLGGFFVGIARGLEWALALTIAFSVVGGITLGLPDASAQVNLAPTVAVEQFYADETENGGESNGENEPTESKDPIALIEAEFEDGIMGKYVNIAAYAIKNKCFLPNAAMFDRLVRASGYQVSETDKRDPDALFGDKLYIYCGLGNLNYTSPVYGEDESTKLLTVDPDKDNFLISTAGYPDESFRAAVTAIMEYNARATEEAFFKTAIKQLSDDDYAAYKQIVTDDNNSIKKLWESVIFEIGEYNDKIAEAVANTGSMTATQIDAANSDLVTRHGEITSLFDRLNQRYAQLSAFGALTIGEYPPAFQISAAE